MCKFFPAVAPSMLKHAAEFAQVSAGFSFSMMGFLAAAMALFSLQGQSKAFKKYRQNGLLRILLIAIAIAIVELALSFVASLRLFISPETLGKIICTSVALAAGFGMVLVTTLPIFLLQIRAASEKVLST